MGEEKVDFGRLLTAMATPFTEDGQLDLPAVDRLVDRLIETGTTGIVVAGTTGESPTLSHEEKLQLFERVLGRAKGRAAVIAGTGSNDTRATVALTREAEALGVDGIMLVCPYYNKPSQEGLYQHFRVAAEATHLPVMVYNVPGRTGVNLSAATTLRLAEVDNIVCVKEAGGDLGQIAEIVERAPDGFRLYSGDDKLFLPTLAVGGYGVVSVASHLVGREMTRMIQAFLSGQVAEAASWHRRLLPLFEGLFWTSSPVLLKTGLAMVGHPVGPVRLPLVEAPQNMVEDFRRILEELRLV
ncbi:MAG: 4-hydroxy-tetrahydrodipicolinate synthase [Kyrpidia tusciae]|nr:4-hydroxy-tetrahydrodipicolinate synthase [Kyrpidia tusciae]MBE3553104.1 4-hydroxy-tetrahydrodipicolinate synthase [Kyrpidia tusciae]